MAPTTKAAKDLGTSKKKSPRKNSSKKPDQPLRLEYVAPKTIKANPANWRIHPQKQVEALQGALDEIGWAGALLYNEKTKRLIDGHARLELALQSELPAVPILIGSWSPADEKKILATFDPIAAMATANTDALGALLADMEVETEGMGRLLDELSAQVDRATKSAGDAADASSESENDGGDVTVWRIVIECESEKHQIELLERFTKQKLKCQALTA